MVPGGDRRSVKVAACFPNLLFYHTKLSLIQCFNYAAPGEVILIRKGVQRGIGMFGEMWESKDGENCWTSL